MGVVPIYIHTSNLRDPTLGPRMIAYGVNKLSICSIPDPMLKYCLAKKKMLLEPVFEWKEKPIGQPSQHVTKHCNMAREVLRKCGPRANLFHKEIFKEATIKLGPKRQASCQGGERCLRWRGACLEDDSKNHGERARMQQEALTRRGGKPIPERDFADDSSS